MSFDYLTQMRTVQAPLRPSTALLAEPAPLCVQVRALPHGMLVIGPKQRDRGLETRLSDPGLEEGQGDQKRERQTGRDRWRDRGETSRDRERATGRQSMAGRADPKSTGVLLLPSGCPS